MFQLHICSFQQNGFLTCTTDSQKGKPFDPIVTQVVKIPVINPETNSYEVNTGFGGVMGYFFLQHLVFRSV